MKAKEAGSLKMQWYVVQVYTGSEETVKAFLEKQMHEEELQDFFGEIVVPTSKVIDKFAAMDASQDREKIFPGYLIIQMLKNGDVDRFVSRAPRVSRILGALTRSEVERIFAQISGECTVTSTQESFTIGSEVHITEGPFAGFVGIVDSLDEEHERVRVMVSIFGRMTPVELGLNEVKQ